MLHTMGSVVYIWCGAKAYGVGHGVTSVPSVLIGGVNPRDELACPLYIYPRVRADLSRWSYKQYFTPSYWIHGAS